MTPSADRVQCPYCLGHPRVKQDGTMYAHDYGSRVKKLCPGAGKTKEAAKAAKSAGSTLEDQSGPPDSIRPEDIF